MWGLRCRCCGKCEYATPILSIKVQYGRTNSIGLLEGVELVVRWLSVTMLKLRFEIHNIAAADLRVRAKRAAFDWRPLK